MVQESMAALPKKSATVILLRDRAPGGFEAFLLRRHERNAFMGGFFVYPGGTVDQADWDQGLSNAGGEPLPPREWVADGMVSREENLACRMAAIREVFEESGILLAGAGGKLLDFGEPAVKERFAGYRAMLHTKQVSFPEMVRKEGLQPALQNLCYYAHWITPEGRALRFDTHFFLARCPAGQEPSPDLRETTEGVWLTPEEALAKNETGAVPLSPPTLVTLEQLSRFGTNDEIFTSLPSTPTPTVLPILLLPPGDTVLIFPWDPEYETYQEERPTTPPDHGSPTGPNDATTRLILTGNRWLPYTKKHNIPPQKPEA